MNESYGDFSEAPMQDDSVSASAREDSQDSKEGLLSSWASNRSHSQSSTDGLLGKQDDTGCGSQRRLLIYCSALAVALILVIVFTAGLLLHTKGNDQASGVYRNAYIRYSVPRDSIGPLVQEPLMPDNATDWLPAHLQLDDFTYRLDSQTLIPTTAFTPYEGEIRAWYAKRYPFLEDIIRAGLDTDPEYLRQPPERRFYPVDDRFHVAHCVITLRRYYKALTDGVHVAPRDMDMGHIDHCLKQLELFALDDELWCTGMPSELQWETTVVW